MFMLNPCQEVDQPSRRSLKGGRTEWLKVCQVARNYSALTLNLANNSTLTQADVVGRASCFPLYAAMCKASAGLPDKGDKGTL